MWTPNVWPSWLADLATQIAKVLGLSGDYFNSCNGNKYDNQHQSLYWHSDNEKLFRQSEFQRNVLIVSVSFGASRLFGVRLKYNHKFSQIDLNHGDILTMEGRMQDKYEHCLGGVPAGVSSSSSEARYNLTFRKILRHDKACPLRTA